MPAIGATNAAIAAISCNEAFKCVGVKCSAYRLLNNTLLLYRPLNSTLQVLLQVRPHNPAANSNSVPLVLARIHYRFLVLFDGVCGRHTRKMGDDSEEPFAPSRFRISSKIGELWENSMVGLHDECDTCCSIKSKYPELTIPGCTTLRDALPRLAVALLSADDEVFLNYEDHVNALTEADREAFRFVTSRCLARDVRIMVVNVCTGTKCRRL